MRVYVTEMVTEIERENFLAIFFLIGLFCHPHLYDKDDKRRVKEAAFGLFCQVVVKKVVVAAT